MSNVYIYGTLILNSDMACTGSVTVEASGKIIPVASEFNVALFSCPTKEMMSPNGKSPTLTAPIIDVIGQIDGNESGFLPNYGPGANSTLKDNFDLPVLFYGATHAGIGFARNVPENFILMSEEFTLNDFQIEESSVVLTYPPDNPSSVAMNIINGSSQEYGVDFTVHDDILTWRGKDLEFVLQSGDQIRVLYLGDELRIMPPAKPRYGSYEAPLSIGSGSGRVSGGSGIRLIGRTVTISGLITMNGGTGTTIQSGGGSGGSVWIIARDITGAGSISAMGGSATYEYAGGGGGGYITFTYENSNTFTGTFNVNGRDGGTEGVVWIDQPKPFFIEKFTGHLLNIKWWEILRQQVVLDSQVVMDTTALDQNPALQSKFHLSGKNIVADLDYNPTGSEISNYNAYFRLCIDDDNWIGISKRYGYIFGIYTIDGIPGQLGVPYAYIPTKFRINKSDSTFTFQFIDSSTGLQTIGSQVLPDFENSKFFARMGMDQIDSSRIVDYFRISSTDILNKSILLSLLPIDATVAMSFLHGTSQYYGTDFYTNGQFLKWDSMTLDGTMQAGDEIEVHYITNLVSGNVNTRWDNFEVFSGILHGIQTKESTIYVDSIYGSDSNDGLRLTPLQNLFVATAWAKRGGTVVLYDGTYNPTEVIGKTLTVLGANGASPLITTADVQDTTGANWENSCLTFRDCQGLVKNLSMTNAVTALYAENTDGLEVSGCNISDSTTGIKFDRYSDSPRVLRNTIHAVGTAVDMSTQVYDPYIYSNVIYDSTNGVVISDASGAIVSSNTIDGVTYGVFFDQTTMGDVASNNLTNSTFGVMVSNDSTAGVYYNNSFGTITPYTGNVDASFNISVDPQYVNAGSRNYHLLSTSPDLNAGIGDYDRDYFDRDRVSRVNSYDIGAYEVVDGSHGVGPYYVAGPGDDYRNFGTLTHPFYTLDKAMSIADNTVIMDGGHYDSFYLKLRSENININSFFVQSIASELTISYVTLTPANIANKYIPIPGLPLTNAYSGNSVALNVVEGSAQVFDVDYTVSTGAILWGGLALDGMLSAGDSLRAIFPSLISAGTVVTLDSYYSAINLSNPIFVSSNGSDSSVFGGDGTHGGGNGSQQFPYRTIDRALQDASTPGTSLIVMSGEYNVFTGRDDAIVVPFSDRTGIPSGKYYLQSLFRTPKSMLPNQTIMRDSDELWNIYSSGNSESSIQNGFLTLAYDGTNACGADSTFTFTAPFTAQADLRQAFDPIFFRVHNEDNTAVIKYFNGDWTSTITTGGQTSSCWGHMSLTPPELAETEEFFTDYLCVSSEDIANKYIPLTYLFDDGTNVAVNIIGGSSQEIDVDFIAEDGKIKWSGLGLENELTPGEILRVIYKAHGISATARFQISLLPSGILEVRGSNRSRWSSLMRRRLYSDTSSAWSSSFYMDQTASNVDHSLVFGRGYASQYFTLAAGFEGTTEAAPYLLKTWRQPIILHNPTADNT